MKLFAESSPWRETQWWRAGKDDAVGCLTPRFDGSDIAEDELRAYMYGYTEGRAICDRTVTCPKFESHKEWEAGHCFNYVPGLLPESWRYPIVGLLFMVSFMFLVLVMIIGTWTVGKMVLSLGVLL